MNVHKAINATFRDRFATADPDRCPAPVLGTNDYVTARRASRPCVGGRPEELRARRAPISAGV
jgi:hypothetical protein